MENKILWIIPLYLNCNNWETDFEQLTELLNNRNASNVLMIGDFNAKVGQEPSVMNAINGINRRSKDAVCNARGKKLLELCDSFALRIQNGTSLSDGVGNFTFASGQGTSVIDYSILETTSMKLLAKLRWKESTAPMYRRLLDLKLQTQEDVDFGHLEEIIKTSYSQKQVKNKVGSKEPWFDEQCQLARMDTFRWLNMFRNLNESRFKDKYTEANKKYKELCRSKKRSYSELEASRLANCKDASEFWKLAWKLNGKQFTINTNLCKNALREHFNVLLNPTPSTLNWQYAVPGFENEILYTEITSHEIDLILGGLKDGKAPGAKGIPAAFDTIDRRALLYKLYGVGLSRKFGRVLEALYKETHAAVWNGAELSDWFETGSGVKQGCALSPTLFALFIDDLIDYLPGGVVFAGESIKALLFADDVVMFANSPETLQLMINRVHDYCRLWSLIVNIEKSKVMIFRKSGGRTASNEKWKFNGENIEIVNDYKYLGVYFSKNLSMEKHFKEKLQKAKAAINISWKKCCMNKNIAHSSKYKVFEAVAETILLYGSQVWGSKKFDPVEQLLRFYVKRIFHLPANTPNYVIMIETGLSPLFIKTLKLQS
ncbi:uncharacterized protein LOC129939883 [Eupeodes corollae]|uniref:uncharacterized protein LOC129939883 n=1 Tax=Eupeodes corollae TaxID=290404 RepID=UPI002492A2A8|nr:uncharacterized protein LOC129939883 [Eupeodes corollae]